MVLYILYVYCVIIFGNFLYIVKLSCINSGYLYYYVSSIFLCFNNDRLSKKLVLIYI